MTEFVSPHLRTVLKTYQDNAPKTLQGPASLSLQHHLINNHFNQYHVHKRELESPTPPQSSSDDDFKRNSSPHTTNSPRPPLSTPQQRDRDIRSTSPNHLIPLPQPPILPHPILTEPDQECGQLDFCELEGKRISCFLLGGEMRLCLPQIFNTILSDFTLDRINRTFDELLIFFSQCTEEQLNEFKMAKILPEDVKSSGLITRTNAERLCSALLHRPDRNYTIMAKKRLKENAAQFRVYHRCFGKCEGVCYPDLFTFKERNCIECTECNGLFSPQRFVCHVCKDKPKENRTCHWGFDSSKWRSYIHVGLDEPNREKFNKMLDEVHEREESFLRREQTFMDEDVYQLKKKAAIEDAHLLSPSALKQEPIDIPPKKLKIVDDPYLVDMCNQMIYQQYHQLQLGRPPLAWLPQTKHPIPQFGQSTSAIPYLTKVHEPPILQHPERVVRMSECEHFERSFQPNVALAPRKNVISKDRSCDRNSRDNDRSSVERHSSVIKCDIQIKQERNQTPISHNGSPELRNNSPETTGTVASDIVNTKSMQIAPISPEGQSGSNEITSSTSPLPNMLQSKQEPISPSPQTPPNLITSPLVSLDKRSQNFAHNSPMLVKLPITITKSDSPLMGNPEFELSTDTEEDESYIGEPDSSNPQNWDMLADLVKNMSKEYQEKILSLFKCLIKENNQMRQCRNIDRKTIEDLRHRERELMQENARLQNQLVAKQKSSMSVSSVIASNSNLSSLSASSNSSLSEYFDDRSERRNSIVEKSDHVIIKPLKKSFRFPPSGELTINNTTTTTTTTTMVPKCEENNNNNSNDLNKIHLVKNENL